MDDQRVIRILKALSDANRFRMVREIAVAGELSCGQVGERFDLGQPTVSHHLKVLADAGILVVRRKGQHAMISVDSLTLDEVAALLPARLRSQPVAVTSADAVSYKPTAGNKSEP